MSSGKVGSLEADLVIIGGGGSGLTAAVAAAEEGIKNVIILEKRRVLGGNAMRACGIFACESPIQKLEMVIADKDELFKTFIIWAHWSRVDPMIVRAYLNKSGDTISWLQKKGIDFMLAALYPNSLRVGHVPSEGGGAQLIKVLADNCQNLGVQILPRTSAKKILLGANGNVTGVMAVKEDGEEFHIVSKSVIITTGGFGGNKELLKKYCPAYYEGMHLHGFAHNGDGLLMAEEIGAAIEGNVPLLKEGPHS